MNSANGAQTRPPEPIKNGAWKLTLNKTPPPNTPLVVLLPVSAPVPPSLSVTAGDPQTVVLTQQKNVAAVSVQPQPTQDSGAGKVLRPGLQGAVLNDTEAPVALLCEKQQLHTLPQPALNAAAIKTEPESPDYSDFVSVGGGTSALQVKEEMKEQKMESFKFCEEKVETTLDSEMKLKDELKSDSKTEIQVEGFRLPSVINGSNNSENLEQSDLLISDVRSESLESSHLLITDIRSESNVGANRFESTGELTEQVETKTTSSQVPSHLDSPLDLRLNVNNSDGLSEIPSQENTVTDVTQGHSQDELEAYKRVTEDSYCTTVEVDLRDDHRDGEEEEEEGEGEPHECMTCGAIILEGDLIEHYMEHAVQGHKELTKSPPRPRSRTGSLSSSSSYCPSASALSSPNTSPPASPPSKRLRSRAK